MSFSLMTILSSELSWVFHHSLVSVDEALEYGSQ